MSLDSLTLYGNVFPSALFLANAEVKSWLLLSYFFYHKRISCTSHVFITLIVQYAGIDINVFIKNKYIVIIQNVTLTAVSTSSKCKWRSSPFWTILWVWWLKSDNSCDGRYGTLSKIQFNYYIEPQGWLTVKYTTHTLTSWHCFGLPCFISICFALTTNCSCRLACVRLQPVLRLNL